ncbi:MAG: bifunctional diaminohydroxyphosphoribosylaminopyrimidine deaminase/5-amino-6-(5-phosphoribosylamino)uracil reductase RibD [Candidatus Omnitrophota bacterium]
MSFEEKYMKVALSLAVKAKGKTYPNPMVGAIIVKGGRILGRGYHRYFGGDHAEAAAIKNAKENCAGSTMFVTLEPCDHQGKTPPCTDAIIKNRVKKVFIAMKDPNPINFGKGIKKLRKAGVEVVLGSCKEEAEKINRKYIKYVTKKLPYVTLKTAQSLDGKIAARDGSSKWISGELSRGYVKRIRGSFSGIMVGANTIRKDDPFLLGVNRSGYKTARITVDTHLNISKNSNIIRTSSRSPVIIGTTDKAPKNKINMLKKIEGVEVAVFKSRNGKVPLKPFLRHLAKLGLMNILVEGGGELAGSLLDEGLIDEVMIFISPKILGGSHFSIKGKGVGTIKNARDLKNIKTKKIGNDILLTGSIKK